MTTSYSLFALSAEMMGIYGPRVWNGIGSKLTAAVSMGCQLSKAGDWMQRGVFYPQALFAPWCARDYSSELSGNTARCAWNIKRRRWRCLARLPLAIAPLRIRRRRKPPRVADLLR